MTTARWAVAKYVGDLRRQEPRNVGVVLWTGGAVYCRFLGERADGSLDGRRLRWAGSSGTFKAWVAYWRHRLTEDPDPQHLFEKQPDANYYVAQCGERMLTGQELDAPILLDYLFSSLVEEEAERAAPSVAELAEQVLARTGIKEKVQRDVRVELPEDAVTFDYRYDNGRTSYMQRVGLIYDDDRSWDVAHAVAWTFRAIKEQRADATAPVSQLIALVRMRPKDDQLDRQLRVLRPLCEVVDLSAVEQASDQLGGLIGPPSSAGADAVGTPP